MIPHCKLTPAITVCKVNGSLFCHQKPGHALGQDSHSIGLHELQYIHSSVHDRALNHNCFGFE